VVQLRFPVSMGRDPGRSVHRRGVRPTIPVQPLFPGPAEIGVSARFREGSGMHFGPLSESRIAVPNHVEPKRRYEAGRHIDRLDRDASQGGE